MTKWISQLARTLGFHDSELGEPCVVVVRKDTVRMSIYEYPVPSGESGYRIELEYLLDPPDTWETVASLRDFNLGTALELLSEARLCIGNLRQED